MTSRQVEVLPVIVWTSRPGPIGFACVPKLIHHKYCL